MLNDQKLGSYLKVSKKVVQPEKLVDNQKEKLLDK